MTAPDRPPLDLYGLMGVAKYLLKVIEKNYRADLLPGAARNPAGSRLPIMYGDAHAGFVGVPHKLRAAKVTDAAKLLAWADANYPDKVRILDSVDPEQLDDVLAVLAEHLPKAIRREPVPDPQWAADLVAALASSGGEWRGKDGKAWSEIPGITVTEAGKGTPAVELNDDAERVIGQAWRDGLLSLDGLLAIEAPSTEGEE